MALILRRICGFETGGLEQAVAVTGTPSVQGTTVKNGTWALNCSPAATVEEFILASDFSGLDLLIGFWFQTADVTPAANIDFFKEGDTGSNINIAIRLKTDGDIAILDSVGTEVATGTPSLTNSQWHFIEIIFAPTGSGDAEVIIDGSSVVSATAEDFLSGGSFGKLYFRGADNTGGNPEVYFDDIYDYTGATGTDVLGDFVVKAYQNTAEDATDQGDTLADGTWALVSETPGNSGTSNDAFYENTGNLTGSTIMDEGTRAGPSGDSDITGATIKAAEFIGTYKRGTGGGRTHSMLTGSDETVSGFPQATTTIVLTTNYVVHTRFVAAGVVEVPTTSDFFQMGFSKSATAGQDIFCGDQWAMLGYVPAAAGGDTTIVAALGSYVLTGFDAGTRWDHEMTAALGQYVYTGFAATTAQGIPILAELGSYVYTGFASNLRWDHLLDAALGSYVYTGFDAGTLRGHYLSAALGSYIYTGFDVTLSRQVALTAALGSYVYTGFDSDLLWDHLLAAALGSYVYTGFDASFTTSITMSAELGSYVYTGFASNLLWGHLLAAALGSYVYTGFDATISRQVFHLAEVGSYVYTGFASDLLWGHLLSMELGSYVYSGFDAGTLWNHRLDAELGSYVYSGFDAFLSRQIAMTAEVGSYTYTGFASNLLWGHYLAAVLGSYIYTGFDATTSKGAADTITAELGSYIYTGFPATLIFSGSAAAGVYKPILRPRRR